MKFTIYSEARSDSAFIKEEIKPIILRNNEQMVEAYNKSIEKDSNIPLDISSIVIDPNEKTIQEVIDDEQQKEREKEPMKNNDKSGSLKDKRQPKKSMKVLEASSENIHKEQTQEFWKKKSFWGLIVVIAIGVVVIKSHALPKGYSDPTDVIEYCMRRDESLNMFQNASLNEEASELFGIDDDDTDHFQLLQNEKTKRYVFRYSFHGKSIPSYVIATEHNNGDYALEIVPVKKNHIASISKTDVSESYVDKYFPSEKYVGYNIDDLEDMDVKLDKHIHYGTGNDKTLVFYDKSENE